MLPLESPAHNTLPALAVAAKVQVLIQSVPTMMLLNINSQLFEATTFSV
jgi:hypothetical protein